MLIRPRSDLGIPTPPSTREKLWQEAVLLAHYTGVGYPTTSRYRSADPVECKRDAQAVANFGASSARTWEYSYMITLDGSIWEQGGEFVAAHCKNFNTKSGAVLFVNAIGVPLTAAQIEAWWWLRDQMVAKGILANSHTADPHYRYRATGCPGPHIAEAPGAKWDSPTGEGQLGNLDSRLTTRPSKPLPPTSPPTSPPSTPGVDMQYIEPPARGFDSRSMRKKTGPFTHEIHLANFAGIPSSAEVVAVTLTAVEPEGGGYATVWSGATPLPNTSDLNWSGNDGAIANTTVTRCSGGKFHVFMSGPAHLLVDIKGYQ